MAPLPLRFADGFFAERFRARCDRFAERGSFAFALKNFKKRTARKRRHFHRRLVGIDLGKRFVRIEFIALVLYPP